MKLLNKYKLSVHSIANFFIILIFALFLPMQEWPDTSSIWGNYNAQNESRNSQYVAILKSFLNFFNLQEPIFLSSHSFSDKVFFNDYFFFDISYKNISINLFKLIFILPLFYFVNKISSNLTNNPLVFAPPYIFSILSVSLEPFAIIFLTVSYLFCISNFFFVSLLIGFLGTLIDRSMAPSFFAIIILAIFLKNIKYRKSFLVSLLFHISIFLIIFFIFYFLIYDILEFYKIFSNDIIYNKQFGENNYLSLLFSLSGLYGWMSLRPFPWPVYYSIIIFFFIYGFYKSDRYKKILFVLFLFSSLITLKIIPPVSQARYFPILTLLYWESVLTGVKYIFGRIDIFIFTVTVMTTLGFLLA